MVQKSLFGGLVACVPEARAGERVGKLGECAIAFFDAANPQDAVVFAVWTQRPSEAAAA
jgi:hypothetical protein